MKRLAFIILTGIAAFSCAKDPFTGGEQNVEGITVRFTTSDFDQVTTRATNENLINDVWVLQYKNGNLVGVPQHLSTAAGANFAQATELTGLVDMPAATNATDSLNSFVCFLANLEAIGVAAGDVTALTTVNALNAMKLDVDQSMTVLPMIGLHYNGVSTDATNQLSVSLQRTVAKINFTFNHTNFRTNSGLTTFTPTSVKLCQTPQQFTLTRNPYRPSLPAGNVNGVLPQGFTPYPSGVAADIMMEVTDNLATGTDGFIAYVAENARGSFGEVLNNKMKNPIHVSVSQDFADQAYFCTYIELVGEYVDGGQVNQATYKIYLGGNALGDMNILSNTSYNVTTYLYGANTADTRITVSSIFDENTLPNLRKPSNSYIINANGSTQTFTVPLKQVMNGWAAINNTIAIATDRVDIEDLFSNDANWDAELLWKTWSGANVTAQPTKDAVGNSLVLPRYMTVTVPGSIANGNNAVIALYDRRPGSATENQIIWSWHLWFTDYAPSMTGSTAANGELHQYISNAFQTGGAHAGKYMMDRNLGATWNATVNGANIAATMTTPATANAVNGLAAYGLLYQWGRKDPFTNTTDTGTSATPAITTSTPIYDKNNNALTSGVDGVISNSGVPIDAVKYAAQNPLTYIANSGDWTMLGPGATNFWGATSNAKSAFDPCPEGYRLPQGGTTSPTTNIWAGLNGQPITATVVNGGEDATVFPWYYQGATLPKTANGRTTGRLFTDDSSTKAWIPASGSRAASSDAFNNVGSRGYNWSGAVSGTDGFYLGITSTTVNPAGNSYRAFGFPVRCIQE